LKREGPWRQTDVKFRAFLLMALTLAPVRAMAQEVDDRARSAARTLAEDGVNALQAGDAATAVDKLERAYQIIKLPTVGLWAARALVKSGRLVTGAERYLDVTRFSGSADPRQEQAKADAAKEHDQLQPRIPTVTLALEGGAVAGTSFTLDGDPVSVALVGTPIPVDPKHHLVRATRGDQSSEGAFDITEGQKLTVTLKLGGSATAPVAAPVTVATPTPPPADDAQADSSHKFWNTQRTIGVAVGGAGVVAAVVSGIFTAGALSKKSDAGCNDGGGCTSQTGIDKLSDARSAGNVATITGIAGLALIGAGVVVFVTAPSTDSGASVALSSGILPGGGFMSARGTF
jgi:hypothetical protein